MPSRFSFRTYGVGERVVIDSEGKVGIGTTSPAEPLHVVSSGNGGVEIEAEFGAPSLIFDVASNDEGRILFREDEQAIASIIWDSLNGAHAMIFKGKGTNTEVMRLNGQGHLGIGTTEPSEALDVAGNISCVALNETSDATLKEAIAPIDDALERVMKLTGVSYLFKAEVEPEAARKRRAGVLAQEVEAVLPEGVRTDGKGQKSVQYSSLIGLLVEAVKEQQGVIEARDAELAELRAQQASLAKRLVALEAAIASH